jgi:ABC-type transport system involved in multi-copper enzyme maturation permease subunit
MTSVTLARTVSGRVWLIRLAGAGVGAALAVAVLGSPIAGLAAAVVVAFLAAVVTRDTSVPWLRSTLGGAIAVSLKELRGRMRGRRAFTIVTLYLAALAAFSWAVVQIERRGAEAAAVGDFPGRGFVPDLSQAALGAQIGQTLFVALLVVVMMLVVFLAPAFTAGAISGERERQTYEMLLATPLPATAVVAGKLLSALVYLLLLIVASIPLMSLVFTFGGVAVDDVVRAYVLLIATAVAFGALGLFLSALVRRSGAATILSYLAVIGLTLASLFVFVFWGAMVGYNPGATVTGRDVLASLGRRPPEALVWLDPAVGVADLACATGSGRIAYYSCAVTTYVTNTPYFGQPVTLTPGLQKGVFPPNTGVDDSGSGAPTAPDDGIAQVVVNPFGVPRDLIWPRIAVSEFAFAGLLALGSILLLSPSRPRLRVGNVRRRGVGRLARQPLVETAADDEAPAEAAP